MSMYFFAFQGDPQNKVAYAPVCLGLYPHILYSKYQLLILFINEILPF